MRSPNLGSRLFSPQKLQVRRHGSASLSAVPLIECETQGCGFPKL